MKAAAKKRTKQPEPSELLAELQNGMVGRTFELMKIAEEEIAAAKKREPGKAALVHEAFKWLCPPPGMARYNEKVYRAHAREIIGRVANGDSSKELAEGTRAEAMVALSRASLVAPLDRTHHALYETLFTEIMGRTVDDDEPVREPWPGASAEALRQLLRRSGAPRR